MAEKRAKGTSELRRFGLAAALAQAILAALLHWRHRPAWPLFAVLGVCFLGSALIAPGLLRPVEKCLGALARAVTFVVSRSALAIGFYLILTPLGLILRATGRSPLALKPDSRRTSYWEPVESGSEYERYDRPY